MAWCGHHRRRRFALLCVLLLWLLLLLLVFLVAVFISEELGVQVLGCWLCHGSQGLAAGGRRRAATPLRRSAASATLTLELSEEAGPWCSRCQLNKPDSMALHSSLKSGGARCDS